MSEKRANIPRGALITEDGRIVLPGQFDPTKTRARPITSREYYELTGRVNASPQKETRLGNSSFDILQNRNVRAFADPRFPGMSVGEMASDLANTGYRLGPRGLVPENQRNTAPQAQMTPEQLRQFNIAAAKTSGNFSAIREKFLRDNPGDAMDEQGNIVRGKPKTPPAPTMKPGTFVDDTPGAASAKAREKFFGGMPKRDGTLAGAAGVDLEKLRPSFDALPTPPAATTPAASAGVTAAQRRQMLRDAATGRMDKFADGRLSEIQSSYGKGSVKVLKPGEARPVAMTTDEFGKPETMKSYLARRKYIQSTKGMT